MKGLVQNEMSTSVSTQKKAKYIDLKSKVHFLELKDVINTCKTLQIPQKAIYTATIIYYKYINMHTKVPNAVVLTATCIALSSKIQEYQKNTMDVHITTQKYFTTQQRSTAPKKIAETTVKHVGYCKKHLEEMFNTEYRFVIETNFDLNYPDPYICLERICKEKCVKKALVNILYILMNDTVFMPLGCFYSIKKIVKAVFLLGNLIMDSEFQIAETDEEVGFLLNQIISFYEEYD